VRFKPDADRGNEIIRSMNQLFETHVTQKGNA
jgi:hypothetical protein